MSTADRPGPAQKAAFAPGLRVEILDAEWVIKRADLTSNGTHSLLGTGISELVREREVRFLTGIDAVHATRPRKYRIVPGASRACSGKRHPPIPIWGLVHGQLLMHCLTNSALPSGLSPRSGTASFSRIRAASGKPSKSASSFPN